MLKQVWVCRRAVTSYAQGKWWYLKGIFKNDRCNECHHTACKGPVKCVLEVKK